MEDPQNHWTVLIGASEGGLQVLLELAKTLDPPLPAPVLVVMHIGANPSRLPELMRHAGAANAHFAADGETPRPGWFHIAPPDQHLLLEEGVMRLSRGPKENHTRPAIDPLFRSAALSLGPRAVGVVLSGQLDDGTAGLNAIKSRGGLALVQDPATAAAPSMPANALRYVRIDGSVPPASLAATLRRLCEQPVPALPAADAEGAIDELFHEQEASHGGPLAMAHLSIIAKPSSLTCPDCGGTLWEIPDAAPPRYRCHTGHGYSQDSLSHAQREQTEHALRAAVRALRERALLMDICAQQISPGHWNSPHADEVRMRSEKLDAQALELVKLLEASLGEDTGPA